MTFKEIVEDIKRQLANYNNEEDALVGLVGEDANTLLAEIDRLTERAEKAEKRRSNLALAVQVILPDDMRKVLYDYLDKSYTED